ncbi:hypothetical protein EVAR_86499_1 [Eumeta japonica]|uniref:Uncharacterized protein n=1 Tax=Eumeta variegata TaxID=151549 RepID=A0A4C1VNU1_EUMVA|nr:hypothetical protein EVAR_86499_1 [Eumeta japonica]
MGVRGAAAGRRRRPRRGAAGARAVSITQAAVIMNQFAARPSLVIARPSRRSRRRRWRTTLISATINPRSAAPRSKFTVRQRFPPKIEFWAAVPQLMVVACWETNMSFKGTGDRNAGAAYPSPRVTRARPAPPPAPARRCTLIVFGKRYEHPAAL